MSDTGWGSHESKPGIKRPRVLAVASAGGHLVQLCRLMPAWEGCDTVIATTSAGYESEIRILAQSCNMPSPQVRVITEANRWQKLRLIRTVLDIIVLLLRVRPSVVVTTGAAPGYLAVRLASLLRVRTVWIDSIANSDELSLSGQMAGKHSGLWLTQWEHLARPNGPHYRGSVL